VRSILNPLTSVQWEDALSDCPGSFHGCIDLIDTVVWSGFVDQETSLS
jgi:hypothetical protein